RPDFAVAGDQIAGGLRGRPNELDGLQDTENVAAIIREALHVLAALALREQRFRDRSMPGRELVQAHRQRAVVTLGGGDEVEQCIGDAATRGQHDAQWGLRIGFEKASDSLHARGIRDTRPAEFMNAPTLHSQRSFRLTLWSRRADALVTAARALRLRPHRRPRSCAASDTSRTKRKAELVR